MEKGPMYCNLKLLTIVLTSNTDLRGIGGEVIVKKFSYNILDKARREQILPERFGKVIYVHVKTSPSVINFKCSVHPSAYLS